VCLLSEGLVGGSKQSFFQKLCEVATSIGNNMNMDFLNSLMDLVHNPIRWNLNFPVRKNIDVPHLGRNASTIMKLTQAVPRLDKSGQNRFGNIRPVPVGNERKNIFYVFFGGAGKLNPPGRFIHAHFVS